MSAAVLNTSIGPASAKAAITTAFEAKRPIFLWGPPGIGKSDIVKQIGNNMNAHVIDVRLSLWDPTDIKGIPYFDSVDSTMKWAPPAELPTQDAAAHHERIILFLDELNSAPPAVQAGAYQLILNRKVGQYTLPDNVLIVAAGNRDNDRGVTYRMPAPLANRFVHIEVRVDWDDWFDWATSSNISPEVVGYLTVNKKDLYDFDPRGSSHSFATPRTWHFVSDLLATASTDNVKSTLISGTVGEGIALKFMAYRKTTSQLPNPRDILKGKVTKLNTKEISAMYSLAINMCYELKDAFDKNLPDAPMQLNNFFRYMMDNFETELVILSTRIAIKNYGIAIDPDEVDCFQEFHERYGKFVSQAIN